VDSLEMTVNSPLGSTSLMASTAPIPPAEPPMITYFDIIPLPLRRLRLHWGN
jgi:hypothetical protein